MELKPGYKQTEVGVIPDDWNVTQLGKCLAAPPSYGINAPAVPYSDQLPVYIRITDISNDGSFMPDRLASVGSGLAKNYYLSQGDIVLARTGASVGKSYLYDPSDGPLVFAGFLIRVRPEKDKLLPSFAAAYITTEPYWRWVRVMSMRSGQPGINGKEYSRLPIPLPCVSEQSAITAILNDLDALLSDLKLLIGKKKYIKQAAMQELLTGKRRLPGFEGEWEMKRLKDIIKTPVTDGPHMTPRFLDTGVPFLSVNNLVNNRIDLSDLRFISEEDHRTFSRKCKPQKGDILLGKAASVGKVAIVESDAEFNIWSPIALARIADSNSPKFIYYALQSRDLASQISLLTNSSSQGNIGMGDIEKLSFRLPDKKEQTAIASALSEMDAELAGLEARMEKAQQLKQGMMQQLLTGKIRLT